MITLIRNELIKLMHRKKTLITLIGFIALITLIAFGLNSASNSNKRYQSPEFQKSNLQNNINQEKAMLNDSSINDQEKTKLQAQITNDEAQLQELNSGKVVDWRTQLKTEIDAMNMQKNDATIPNAQKENLNSSLMLDQYLLDNNIKPVSEIDFNGSNYLFELLMILGAIFLAIGVAIFSSDIVSGEYSPATAKFLLTQPVSRGKVLLSKFITAVLTSVFLICIVEIIAFVIVGLTVGFGNMNYPKVVGTIYQFDMNHINSAGGHDLIAVVGSSHIITTGQFLILGLLLQILFVVTCTSFIFMLSTIFKNSMIVMSSSIVAIIAVTILQNFAALKKIASFIFLIYGSVGNALTGDAAMELSAPYVTTTFIIILMVAWTIICYIISHIIFVKRDLLI